MSTSEIEAVEPVLQHLAADGTVGSELILLDETTPIGRIAVGLACPDDVDMADCHARVRVKDGLVVVSDSGEGSGVWLRIMGSQGRLLRSGDQVWLGAQILVVRREGNGWQIRHHGPDGRVRETYSIPAAGLFIGRASDLVLDLDDSRLSRRHAQLVPEGEGLRVYDRGAHNGTYLKLVTAEPLSDGDEFRLAKSSFRYVARRRASEAIEPAAEPLASPDGPDPEFGVAAVAHPSSDPPDPGSNVFVAATPSSQPTVRGAGTRQPRGLGARLRKLSRQSQGKSAGSDSAESQAEESPVLDSGIGSGMGREEATGVAREDGDEKVLVVIDSDAGSVSLEVSAGKTVLEGVREAGLARGEPVDWECGDGGCGVCIVGVVEGASRLDPPDPMTGEMKTIQVTEQVVPDPRKYRLACLARVRGTVRLRKLT